MLSRLHRGTGVIRFTLEGGQSVTKSFVFVAILRQSKRFSIFKPGFDSR